MQGKMMARLKNIFYSFLKPLIAALLLLVSPAIYAQKNSSENIVQSDWQSWLGTDFEYEASKNVSFALTHQVRHTNNISTFKVYFIQLDGIYKLNDLITKIAKKQDTQKNEHTLKIAAGYRYMFTDAYSQNSQRVLGSLSYQPFIAALQNVMDISFRTTLQHDFTWNRQDKRTLWRAKVAFDYPIELKIKNPNQPKNKKKLDATLFTGCEYFHQLAYTGNSPFRLRWQAGLGMELPNFLIASQNKRNISLRYVGQRSLNNAAPSIDHIVAFSYGISF